MTTPDSASPHVGDALTLGAATYAFAAHPLLPAASGEPYAQEGAEAVVYQLRRLADGALFALKAPKPAFRHPRAVAVTAALARLADACARDATPGFSVARRVCLTRDACPGVLARWPTLEYATLMPWVAGRSWTSWLLDHEASRTYTPAQALALATALTAALLRLGALGGAHTDLAGDNLMLTADGYGVELIDLEGVYAPGLPRPARVSHGTAGYQPRFLAPARRGADGRRWRRRRGPFGGAHDLWRADGDRFAAAILLTELLCWADDRTRAATPPGAESLFQPQHLELSPASVGRSGRARRRGPHDDSADAQLATVRSALDTYHPSLVTLFDRAWQATTLSGCPAIGEWAQALAQAS